MGKKEGGEKGCWGNRGKGGEKRGKKGEDMRKPESPGERERTNSPFSHTAPVRGDVSPLFAFTKRLISTTGEIHEESHQLIGVLFIRKDNLLT